MRVDHTLDPPPDFVPQRIWNYVSRSPLHSLWNLQGIPLGTVAKRTWKSFLADNLLGRSGRMAEAIASIVAIDCSSAIEGMAKTEARV